MENAKMKNKKAVGIGCLAALGVIAVCAYINVSWYDNIGEYNKFGLAKAEKSGKFGYIDQNKKQVIPVEFESVEDFTDAGMTVVTGEEGEGIYRFDGTCILPLEYQEIELGAECANDTVAVSLDGEANFIDMDGTVLYESTAEGPMSLLKVQSGGKYGFADQDGTVVLPCGYTQLEVLSDNGDNALLLLDDEQNFMDRSGALLYDEVEAGDEDGWLQVKDDGNYGYVSAANETLVPVKYASLKKEGRNSAGYIRLAADDKLLLTDETGALLYKDTRSFEPNNLAAVQDERGMWGYIDREGEIAVACLYDEVDAFNEYGLSRAKSGELYGYIDETGVQVIPCLYDEVEFNEYGIVRAREGKEVSFLSSTGQKQFDKVGAFSSKGVTLAGKGHSFFFINNNGNRINELDYDSIHELQDAEETEVEGFLTCKGIRYGLADDAGEEIISAEYDEEAVEEIAEKYCLWAELKAGLDSITAQASSRQAAPGLDLPEIIEFDA